jgi:hypothetical protein
MSVSILYVSLYITSASVLLIHMKLVPKAFDDMKQNYSTLRPLSTNFNTTIVVYRAFVPLDPRADLTPRRVPPSSSALASAVSCSGKHTRGHISDSIHLRLEFEIAIQSLQL